jgi:hypothetical protein
LATKEEKAALQGMIDKGMAQKDAELIIETYKKNNVKFNLTTDEFVIAANEFDVVIYPLPLAVILI